MANIYDQFDAPEPTASGGGGNIYDQFDPPPPSGAGGGGNIYDQFDSEEERRRRSRIPERPGKDWDELGRAMQADPYVSRPEKPPEAEGMLATGAREAAHGVLPAVAGAGAGLLASGAAGAVLGSIVPVAGTLLGGAVGIGAGLIGGGLGGYAASTVQEEGLKALGADDSVQRAINAKINPWSSAAGSAASGLAGFGVGSVGGKMRALSGAISGATEAGVQAYQGEFDPAKLAASTAAGAIAAKPYNWGSRLEAQGAALGERLRPKVEPHGSAGPESSVGIAEQATPATRAENQTGDPQNKVTRSERDYPAAGAEPAAPGGGVHVGDVDPTVKAALDAKTADTAPPPRPEPPTEYGTKLDQEFPTGPNGETAHSLRVGDKVTTDTGDSFVVLNNMKAGNSGDRLIELRWDNGKETAVRASELESTIRPSPYVDAQTGERKLSAAANIERASAVQPSPREAIEQRAPDTTVGGALREAAAARRQDVIRGPEPEGVRAPAEVQGGGGGAQEPPGSPPGTPPPGAAPPPEPPLSAAQQLGQQTKRTLDQLKNIFAPQTRGPQARELATQIRGASGELTQLHEQARDVLNKHRDTENTMSQEDLRKLVNRAQGGDAFPDWKPNQAQQAELGDIKRVTDMWANKLGTLDRAKQMDWIKNYLPGMYKNADANPEFFQNMGRGQGGAGSLKQKTFPDYEAARAAGLEPLTNSPIEMLELYGSQMRKFIAKQEVMEKNLKSGTFIKSQPPERIGAAGSPEPQVKSNLPPNYIESRASPGMYMPEEVVHVWDNFHSPGLAGGRNKDVYGALRTANAAWTNLELSLNGYHAFTMANESFISDVAMGIEKIAGGKVASGLKTIAQAPAAPYRRAKLGSEVQQSYLDPNSTDPITQSLVKAGFRPIGRSHAADSMLGQKTFLDSFKDLPKQLKQAASETQQGWTDANGDLLKQVAYPFRLAQRAIATVSHPLFEVYIPKLKAGAAYAEMQQWREFNPDKIGTAAEIEGARKIVDSVDNRYGEMIADHLFMNKVVQDMGVAGMRSFSWFMGSMKEIGGGTYSGARAVARAAIERDPSRLGVLNPSNRNYDPRTAYAVAMPMVIAATSAMYQALLGSHDAPESWRDLYAPRTGGMVAGPGGSRVQEHMLMPGYHKDVYGWLAHPGGEAYNKLSGVWSTAIEEARGRGSPSIGSPPIIRPNASFTENVTDRMSYLFSKLGPIGAKAFLKGQKEGSEIPNAMAAIGFHPPGMEIQAPEKIHAIQSKQEKREWKTMTKRANRDAMSRGQELPYPPRPAQ